jgi:hypothetical protein
MNKDLMLSIALIGAAPQRSEGTADSRETNVHKYFRSSCSKKIKNHFARNLKMLTSM